MNARHNLAAPRALPALWAALTAHRARLAAAVGLLVAAKLATVAVPLVLKAIIDGLGRPETVAAVPVLLLLGYAALRFAGTLFGELRDRVFSPLALRTVAEFTLQAFVRLLELSPRFHAQRETGALMRDVERGTAGIAFLLGVGLFTIVPTIVEIAAVIAIMVYRYGDWYTAILAGTFLLYAAYTVEFTRRRAFHQRALNELDSRAAGYLVDRMMNYDAVKTYAREGFESNRFREIMDHTVRTGVRNQTALSSLHIGQSAIIAAGVGAVMLLAGRSVVAGSMTVGDLVLINAYVIQVCLPLNALGFVFRQVRDAMVDVERLFSLLELTPEPRDAVDARELAVTRAEIRFEHVHFGYGPGQVDLQDIDFTIPAGTTVAVVGASGSGKSTLARLLLRLYEPQSGHIRIDGQDIGTVTQGSLRSAIGVVPQDTSLFNDTIAYNILYGRPGASMEEVTAAARSARIHDFIESLPDRYSTRVGERGLKLSGGEKQRIAIARAMLKNPPIMIFDEATSALDPFAERAIQAELDRLAHNRTALVIAHRMTTIVGAEMILVLERGRIIERGTHQALMERNGVYARMWAVQQQQRAIEEAERMRSRQPVNLASVAANTLDALQPSIATKGLHLYTFVDSQAARAMADPRVVQFAASLLLSSAVAAVPAGSRLEVMVQRAGTNARLQVGSSEKIGDLPPGFDEEALALRESLAPYEGTLVLERDKSRQGFRFSISFPLRAVAEEIERAPALVSQADVPAHDRIASMLARAELVLIEDSEDARNMLVLLLGQAGAHVRGFGDAAAAYEWFEGTPHASWPDVLICDIGLPDEDGHSLVNRLRALEAGMDIALGSRMPAIALTGRSRAEDRTRALLAGFQMHLVKPVKPEELFAAIVTMMEEKRRHADVAHPELNG